MRTSGTGVVVLLGQFGSFIAPYTKLIPELWMLYALFATTTLLGAGFVLSLHETRNKPIVSNETELQKLYDSKTI